MSSQLARRPGSGKFPKSLSRVDGVGKHAFVAGGNYAASYVRSRRHSLTPCRRRLRQLASAASRWCGFFGIPHGPGFATATTSVVAWMGDLGREPERTASMIASQREEESGRLCDLFVTIEWLPVRQCPSRPALWHGAAAVLSGQGRCRCLPG